MQWDGYVLISALTAIIQDSAVNDSIGRAHVER